MNRNIVKASTTDELRTLPGYPSAERLCRGPVAVIECNQEIPCNPCEDICPRKAITVGNPITNLPVLDDNLCTGCGLCIAGCPGQAIFVVDKTFSEDQALVALPYEYLPLPAKGDTVKVANRDGEIIGEGVVNKIINVEKNNKTNVVYVAVNKSIGEEVRAIVCR